MSFKSAPRVILKQTRSLQLSRPLSLSAAILTRPAPIQRDTRVLVLPQHCARAPCVFTQKRYESSAAASTPKAYSYNDVKTLSETPSPSRIIIDVREPGEYAEGFIPGALNMPLQSAPDGLLLPADEFEERFGFEKPRAEQELVFYCKAGVRSNAAARLAGQVGFANVAEYRGSWMDWVKNGGKIAR